MHTRTTLNGLIFTLLKRQTCLAYVHLSESKFLAVGVLMQKVFGQQYSRKLRYSWQVFIRGS